MATELTDAQRRSYQESGYIIWRDASSQARIAALRDGINTLMDRGLAGDCELRWIDRERRLPGRISSMLLPDKYVPVFGQWLAEDLAPLIDAMLGTPARHSLFGMLAGGGGEPYLQAWHRDIAKPGAPDETEFLRRHDGRFVQFNAPLQPGDRYLNIVPGSHTRASTAAEIAAMNADPVGSVAMPGAMVVDVDPGDVVMYNANLWHRGWNPEGGLRWTMHAAFWRPEYTVMKHEHGQRDAFLTPGFLAQLPLVTRQYIQRYLDAYPEGEPPSLFDL